MAKSWGDEWSGSARARRISLTHSIAHHPRLSLLGPSESQLAGGEISLNDSRAVFWYSIPGIGGQAWAR
jgi:hypothetical protein